MIALIQRVRSAHVAIDEALVGEIGVGLVALVAAVPTDDDVRAKRLADRVLDYRCFPDARGRMNVSAIDAHAAVMAVPQFTLAADTRRGNRPGFSTACPPDRARRLFDVFVDALSQRCDALATGRFGADMQVHLINDGPVTFWLES